MQLVLWVKEERVKKKRRKSRDIIVFILGNISFLLGQPKKKNVSFLIGQEEYVIE